MKIRTRMAAVAVAGAVALTSMTGTAAAEGNATIDKNGSTVNTDASSKDVNLSGYGGLAIVGALAAVVFLEGIVSVLNAPYCGANPDKCPNSLTASLSSGASSQLDMLRHQVPRIPIR
ncbi:hypothetical protein ACFSSC_11305 [Corynebacterium mendelii]|uniref:DUF2613 domain-containing protein n=1 Tax=Corynebacterium mendelii TaxID=2765362 RepID=A0A939DZ24_9CORY|nr:hypothetical protein [Corynebacterium mendelii]MBN9643663.1 hypothetical protein [Corynebacterium mendelii]